MFFCLWNSNPLYIRCQRSFYPLSLLGHKPWLSSLKMSGRPHANKIRKEWKIPMRLTQPAVILRFEQFRDNGQSSLISRLFLVADEVIGLVHFCFFFLLILFMAIDSLNTRIYLKKTQVWQWLRPIDKNAGGLSWFFMALHYD